MAFTAISCTLRSEKSFHSAVLMVPSGFIAHEPLPVGSVWPMFSDAVTAPSVPAMADALRTSFAAAVALSSEVEPSTDPPKPPLPVA
ncbi:hypothetical protein D3C86_1331570 [compost metagenome]